MARIVCQVLQRPEQITFIWSQDQASFEPYHLVGAEAKQFYDVARQARASLAAMLEGNLTQEALARSGHELFRLIFRAGAGESEGSTPHRVQKWLHGLSEQAAIDSLEIVSDVPGRIPWNVVCEQGPSGQPSLDAFWGVRYPLATGRRVNPLRLDPIISEPNVLLVLDPAGAADEQTAWRKESGEHAWPVVTSVRQLLAALEVSCPDLICWVGRSRGGALILGDDAVTLKDLRAWIDASPQGNLEPLILLQAENAGPSAAWGDMLEQAALAFPGLIGWQEPSAATVAGNLGRDAVRELLTSARPLGQVLRELRQKHGWPGLALTAFCPSQMYLAEAEVEPTGVLYELPAEPYQPLRSLDREDRPLLGGRDRDIFRFTGLLDQPADTLLLLHGAFGVGKASFLRAGVLAFLEDDAVGYLALRDRTVDEAAPPTESDYPVLVIRATEDLAGQLAEALCAYCDQPFRYTTPLENTVTVPLPDLLRQAVHGGAPAPAASTSIQTRPIGGLELPAAADSAITIAPSAQASPGQVGTMEPLELWQSLKNDPDLLGRLLETLSRNLPHDLLILIEQGEDLITQPREPQDTPWRRRALDMLIRAARRAPRCKLVLSLRTDFVGRVLAEFPDGAADQVREYLLPELGRDQLLEVLLLPTASESIPYTDEVPFNEFRLTYPEGLADKLVDRVMAAAARSRQSAVALLQAVGARLHARARLRSVTSVTDNDLKSIGDIDGVVKKKADQRLQSLAVPRLAKRTLRRLLTGFYKGQPDGTVTCKLITMNESLKGWRPGERGEAERAIAEAEEAGLVTTQHFMIAGREDIYVSLANDTLARVAQDWKEEKTVDQPAWKRGMIDTLWVTIPLICVAAALTHFFTRRHFGAEMVAFNKEIEKVQETRNKFNAQAQGMMQPQYVGFLQQAQAAWEAGNMVHMRQLLLSQQVKPQRSPLDEDGRKEFETRKEEDLRGFEWYYLWRLANGEKWALPGHEAPVAAVAVSPDGSVIASGSSEGKLYLWDHARGTRRATLVGHSGAVNALTFSGDGKWLISAGADKIVRLWDARVGKDAHVFVNKAEQTLSGHTESIFALACHEKDLASAGADKTVMIWDLDKAALKHTLKDHAAAVNALAFAGTGKLLASGDANGKLMIWDPAAAKKLHSKEASTGPVRAVAFSPDGKWLYSGGNETHGSLGSDQNVGAIRIWDAATGRPDARKGPEIVHGTEVFALSLSPDGKLLASAGKDNFVRLWDASNVTPIGTIKGHLGWVRSLAFAPNSQSLVSGSYDTMVKVWQPRPSQDGDVLTADGNPLSCLAMSADDSYLAAAGKEGSVHIWSLASNKLLQTLKGLGGPVTSLAFGGDPRKPQLAAAARIGKDDGLIKIWDVGEEKGTFAAKEARSTPLKGRTVECLAFAPDGKKLAYGGSGKSIEIWDLDADAKSEPIKLGDDLKPSRCLAFSPDGLLLGAGSGDNSFRIWHLKVGKEIAGSPYEGHGGPVLGLSFYKNIVLSSAADGLVKIWIAQEGKAPYRPFWTYRSHVGPVAAVAAVSWSSTEMFVSAGSDRTVKIWQPIHGDRLALKGHTGPIRGMVFSSNATIIATASDDGTVRLWRAPLPKVERQEK